MGKYTTLFFNASIGFILLLINVLVSSGTSTDQVRLLNNLLKNYDRDARPVRNASEKIIVRFLLEYNQLQALEEPTQVLESLVWITLYWRDASLKWNPDDYGGYSVLNLNPSRIWTPDIELYGSTKQDAGHVSNDKFRILVDSDGNAMWSMRKILHSTCAIDVARFPFDIQSCTIAFSSWTYDKRMLDLQFFEKDGIDLEQYRENSEWKLKTMRSRREEVKYKCCPAPFVDLFYTVEFERKPLYYIMTIVVPSMLLSFLACISFLFPASSGERVSLVISVLLGLVVFMLIVNDRTPVTSDSVPMITTLFNCIGATAVLALMATAFILNLNHVTAGVAVPRYLAKIRDCIAVALCMKKAPLPKRVDLNFEDILINESSTQYINVRHLVGQTPGARKPLIEQKILLELQKLSKHLEEENIAKEMEEDWHYTTTVFDRLFFVLFFIIFWVFAAYVLSFL